MARSPRTDAEPSDPQSLATEVARLGRLIALHLCKDMTNAAKVQLLRAAGYSTAETASLLGLTNHNVAQIEYAAKQTKGKRRSKKR